MMYRLNRQLFLENGPTALLDSARQARATSDAYLAFRQAGEAASPKPDAVLEKPAA